MSLLYRIQLNHVGKKNTPAYINFFVTLLRRVAQRKVTIQFQDHRGDRASQRPRKRSESRLFLLVNNTLSDVVLVPTHELSCISSVGIASG